MNARMKRVIGIFFIALPALTFAVTAPTSFAGFVNIIICLALDFVPIIILVAFLEFIRGLINYISSGDNEEKRSEGIKFMVYGMIGFFVMISVWGALKVFTSTFSVSYGIPQFKSSVASVDTSGCSNVF